MQVTRYDRWHERGTQRHMIRLFIADDHPIVRAGLRHIVEEDPDMTVTGEAASRHEMLQALSRLFPAPSQTWCCSM
jgi:two-component system, NarL family, response regulator DevR